MQFEIPRRIGDAMPDNARAAQIRKAFTESAVPVRPMPSNAAMVLASVAVFVALAILFSTPLGFPGFVKMSVGARVLVYTAIILSCAAFMS